MFKRICALVCITISVCVSSECASSTNYSEPPSLVSRIYSYLVDSFHSGFCYIRSFFCDSVACAPASPSEELYSAVHEQLLDDIQVCDDDSGYIEDMSLADGDPYIYESSDDADDYCVAAYEEGVQGLTETDLVQLLEQLQEALGEPDQEPGDQMQAECGDISPTGATLEQLLQELENAPVVCTEDEQFV